MYLPVFWGMNPGERSFTRSQARKKFLFLALVFEPVTRWSVQWTWPIIRWLGEICFSQKSPIGEQSSIGRQADQNYGDYSDGTYYFELALIFSTTKDLLKTKQAKDSGRRSGAVIEYYVSLIWSSPRCCSTRHMCTMAIYRDHIHCTLSEFIITFITWKIPKKTSTVKILMTLTVTHNQKSISLVHEAGGQSIIHSFSTSIKYHISQFLFLFHFLISAVHLSLMDPKAREGREGNNLPKRCWKCALVYVVGRNSRQADTLDISWHPQVTFVNLPIYLSKQSTCWQQPW